MSYLSEFTAYSIEEFKLVIDKAIDYYDIEVDITSNGSTCDTLAKITEYYNKHSRLLVWKGESENTIYDSIYYNVMFRAWHDYHHIKRQLSFDVAGEKAVASLQKNDVTALLGGNTDLTYFCDVVLDAEIIEQVSYYETHGKFIENQRQFSLDYIGQRVNLII